MKTVPGLLAQPADTWAKNGLPSSRNPPHLSLASPSRERVAASVPLVLMCRKQKSQQHQLPSLSSYLLCQVQLEHSVRLLFALRSLQGPSQISIKLRFDQFDVIKTTGWIAVSFPLVLLHERKQGLMISFGSCCVAYIRLKDLWLPTATERRE